jgi:hydrogenase nickel incorporation protein HypA/HybF
MHEVALARSVVEIALEHARQEAAVRVRAVRLAVGALSHVEPRALAFGFEAVARGTIVEGARLEIERRAGRARCEGCGRVEEIAGYGAACPGCGGYGWKLLEGDEMRVVALEVE